MKENILIIGSVASGKNTLMDKLKETYELNALDTGKVYRYLASIVDENTEILPKYEKLLENDLDESNRIKHEIFKWNRTIANALDNLKVLNGKLYVGEDEIGDKLLYSKKVNALVPTLAKSEFIRQKVINFINKSLCQSNNRYIMTGHNVNEIDTSNFILVYLKVDDEEAAKRLYYRNPTSYGNLSEAEKEVKKRNLVDGIIYTDKLIPSIYNSILIDTTHLSTEEIYDVATQGIDEILKDNYKFKDQQREHSIDRKNFKWIFNPFLEVVKGYLDRCIDKFIIDKKYISKTDLEYQVLIKMCSYDLSKIFTGGQNTIQQINQSIKNRTMWMSLVIANEMSEGKISLNTSLIDREISCQIEQLDKLYNSNFIRNMMTILNQHSGEKIELNDICYKRVEPLVSEFIARNCHYLHTPRKDEIFSYGAFIQGFDLPIAWVSYSKQDRSYKQQVLSYLGLESQNTLEMTRAWCSNSAPKNIMSSLFQYSINDVKKHWKELKEGNMVNKDLQAITTTINPNLGFKASSFMGCNFITFALRPARFTYGEKDGKITYMTRREIQQNNMQYIENKFNVLPLNENIMCLDEKKKEEILKSPICIMDSDNYDKVLEKGDKNEKDIDSYQK